MTKSQMMCLDKDVPKGDKTGECYICGAHTVNGFEKKKIIKKTFTNQTDCLNITSDVVCEFCAYVLAEKNKYRSYSLYADNDKSIFLKLEDLKDVVKNVKAPFLFIITTSHKKHLFFNSKICFDDENLIINLELQTLYFKKSEFIQCVNFVEKLYNSEYKINKSEILNKEFHTSKALKIGIKKYAKIIEKLNSFSKDALTISVHVAQKEVKNDI